MATITFTHDIQVAHRLYTLPGKCQQIHGHSMTVHISLTAEVVDGIIGGWDFHDIKGAVRHYLDTMYDHRLLLNADDPWAQPVALGPYATNTEGTFAAPLESLPGLVKFDGDPTTENIAKRIWKWASEEFDTAKEIQVTVRETSNTAITLDRYGQ